MDKKEFKNLVDNIVKNAQTKSELLAAWKKLDKIGMKYNPRLGTPEGDILCNGLQIIDNKLSEFFA
jgi:hypothetical protein